MAKSHATPPLLKDLNERTVLDAIRSAPPISRAEISRRVGISKPTVSLALQSLVQAGLVRETAHDGAGPSYGATFFEAVPEAAFVLGLDLGARFVRGAVCDLGGEVRARQDLELAEADAAAALETIEQLARSLLDAGGIDARIVDNVVLGVPGAVQGSSIKLAMNVAGLEDSDFGGLLSDRLGLPVSLENDINLAALGERWRGVARGVADFVFISIGTGLGAGLVLRGELHRGHTGAAGELDYLRVGMTDDIDPCAGALASYAQGIGMTPPYDPRSVFAAARAGGPGRTAGRGGGGAPDRAASRTDRRGHRRRPRRAGRRDRGECRPGGDPCAARRLAALAAARRGVEPRRRRRADRRARGRAVRRP